MRSDARLETEAVYAARSCWMAVRERRLFVSAVILVAEIPSARLAFLVVLTGRSGEI